MFGLYSTILCCVTEWRVLVRLLIFVGFEVSTCLHLADTVLFRATKLCGTEMAVRSAETSKHFTATLCRNAKYDRHLINNQKKLLVSSNPASCFSCKQPSSGTPLNHVQISAFYRNIFKRLLHNVMSCLKTVAYN